MHSSSSFHIAQPTIIDMKLKIDTDDLVKKQVISPETADEIIQYYDSKQNTTIGKYALTIVASLFVLVGIGYLVNDFWPSVDLNTKIFFSLLPILGGSAACYGVATRFPSVKILTESVAVLQCIAIGLTVSMLIEAFHLPLNGIGIILFITILCFPFLIYFRAAIVAAILIIISAFSFLLNHNVYSEPKFYLLAMLIGAMDGLFLYKVYFKEKEQLILSVRCLIAPSILAMFMIYFGVGEKWNVESACILSLLASCYLLTFSSWNRTKKWLDIDDTWLELGAFILSFGTLIYCASNNYSLYNNRMGAWIIIPCSIPLILSWVLQYRNKIKLDIKQAHTFLAAIIIALTPFIVDDSNNIIYILLMLLFLGYHTYYRIRHFNIIFFSIIMVCWMNASLCINHLKGARPWMIAVSVLFLVALLIGRQLLSHKKTRKDEIQGDK